MRQASSLFLAFPALAHQARQSCRPLARIAEKSPFAAGLIFATPRVPCPWRAAWRIPAEFPPAAAFPVHWQGIPCRQFPRCAATLADAERPRQGPAWNRSRIASMGSRNFCWTARQRVEEHPARTVNQTSEIRMTIATASLRYGATVHDEQTEFRLWAPQARSVTLRIVGQDDHPMQRQDEDFVLSLPARTGDRYFYLVDGSDPRSDPVSRFLPEGVHGPTQRSSIRRSSRGLIVNGAARTWANTLFTNCISVSLPPRALSMALFKSFHT